MTTLTRASVPIEMHVTASPEVARAYAACRELTRARARNFYYGLCLTPEPKRSAIFSIYAWMRRADDEADAADASGDTSARLARLAERRHILTRIVTGEASLAEAADADPVCIALAHTLRSYPVNPDDLFAMLDGLEEDTTHAGYATRADLARYCYRVASTVGLICVSIWGLREGVDRAEARRLAERRGLGFQLTNILRDYSQDFDESPRRVYLPAEDFARLGVTPEDVRAWSTPEACELMIHDLARWARGEYEASAPLDAMIQPSCRPTLWAMTRIYSGLLSKIEARPERVVGARRIRLQSAHKAGIAAAALVKARRDRW